MWEEVLRNRGLVGLWGGYFAIVIFQAHHYTPMIDTTDLKRELDELTNRLGKTQDYL